MLPLAEGSLGSADARHRLMAMVASVVLVGAALTGNMFAVHLAMAQSPSSASYTGAPPSASVADAASMPAMPSTDSSGSSAPPQAPASQHAGSQDAQHLMHVVGACLAITAAVIAIVLACLRERLPSPERAWMLAAPRLVSAPRGDAWWPPPPSPPTLSPVIRT